MDKIIATWIVGAFAGRWQHHLSQDRNIDGGRSSMAQKRGRSRLCDVELVSAACNFVLERRVFNDFLRPIDTSNYLV